MNDHRKGQTKAAEFMIPTQWFKGMYSLYVFLMNIESFKFILHCG